MDYGGIAVNIKHMSLTNYISLFLARTIVVIYYFLKSS